MDYIFFIKEKDEQERAFLCCSKSEITLLLDSVGMNPGKEILASAFMYLENGKPINLDNSQNTELKIRIDKIVNGNIKFDYTDLVIDNVPNLAIPVRNISDIIKNA